MAPKKTIPRSASKRGLDRTVYPVLLIILIGVMLFGRGLGLRRARASVTPSQTQGVIPGEFERQEAVLLSWPLLLRSPDLPTAQRRDELDSICCDIVRALEHDTRVLVLATKDVARDRIASVLTEANLPADSVEFLPVPANYEWIRDYGPVCLRLPNGLYALVDADYCTTRLVNPHPQEDRVPKVMGEQLGVPVVRAPITIQHGNLLSNGRGLCITTQLPLMQNRARGYSEEDVTRVLREYYGAKRVLYLEGMVGERTGHVDMFATFTAADTVVVGQYAEQSDPINAAILDRNAARLAALEPPYGPLRVVRIPMPRRPQLDNGDQWWPTHTNVVYGNGKLLVPVYPGLDPQVEAAALSIYRRLLPEREVIGIDAAPLLSGGGSLHCITSNLFAENR